MVIITGSFPPNVCGVGDYTAKILQSDHANSWHLYCASNWKLGTLFKHIFAISKFNDQRINLQYPTHGYGWSIVPHLICIFFSLFSPKIFSVTIHEFSQSSLKAKLASSLLLITANKVIFTTDFEYSYAIKRIPFLKKRSTIIKIYTNIEPVVNIKSIFEREYDLLNFGHIRPRKGLEEFLTFAKLYSADYKIAIVGQVPAGYQEYYLSIYEEAQKNGIQMIINLPSDSVSALLNNTKLSYLPFPDGASERRGSLLASFVNGAVVLSSVGKFTSNELADAIIASDENINLIDLLSNVSLLDEKQKNAFSFMNNFMPHSWNDVAMQYDQFI